MKKWILAILVAISFIFPMSRPIPVRASSADPFAELLAQRMPQLLARYRVPGAVVSYIRDGEVAWTQAYGLANVASGKVMSSEMIFNFGSTGKVLTAWGVMRLVEEGKVDLDLPVNRYLKRWQIQSTRYDPDKVTLRRLLSHTAGLSVSGFNDYSPRRIPPSLVQMLEGQNQTDGPVVLFQEPGTGFQYSGGGYALIQMVIEDVSGESFAQFMDREVSGPLMIPSLHWVWTPELTAAAPTPYGPQQEPLEYRQLASQAVGSEIATVPDYARFVAAAVSGANQEPAGREVLTPETIAAMVAIQPGTQDEGLGYGVSGLEDGKLLQHFGANNGWTAFFSFDTGRREGLVLANNSSNGFPLNAAVQNLWLAFLTNGTRTAFEPEPAPQALPLAAVILLSLAGLLALALALSLLVFVLDLRTARRAWSKRVKGRGVLAAGLFILATGLWVYWFYTPFPLPFAPSFADFWRMPQTDLVTILLVGWVLFSLVTASYPKRSMLNRQV